jgi:glutamate/tyrosine decarboxylase-like PLP-dependent enzyme
MSPPIDRREQKGRAEGASLDLSVAEMRELSARFVALTEEYFRQVAELPVFPDTSADELSRRFAAPLPAEREPLEDLIEDCRAVINASRQNGHPRMFGYIASPATPPGAFAGLLASAINSNVTSWRSAPAATEVEKTVVRWLAEMTGFLRTDGVGAAAAEAGGLLTSGGSMANLNALFIAHRSKASEWGATAGGSGLSVSARGLYGDVPATIYATDQVHLSIPKAADVLGLGREQVRLVPTDGEYRMDVRLLRERIAADLQSGLRPCCVVASAGTVATGAVDPLEEIARVAREHSLWFHVDGAYGALAALDASRRQLFAGLDAADSLSLDPHKWLYAPVGCGCLLLRSPERARAAFNGTEEDYIRVYEREPGEAFAFWDYGVELSRPFRALSVWLMLRYYGLRRISAAVAEDNALARYMAERVGAAEDFELLAPATLGICCFRYVSVEARRALEGGTDEERDAAEAGLDRLNARIMHRVQRGGEAYLSNANLSGRFALRASITNFRTTRRDVDTTLEVVRRAAAEAFD